MRAEDSALGLSNDSDSSSSTNGEEGGEDGNTSSPEVDEPKLLEWAEGATPLKGLHEGDLEAFFSIRTQDGAKSQLSPLMFAHHVWGPDYDCSPRSPRMNSDKAAVKFALLVCLFCVLYAFTAPYRTVP